MEDHRITEILYNYNPAGKRYPERPEEKWKGDFLI
jgi:hypothetical protein